MAGLVKELGFDRCVLWVVRGNEARAAVRCENEAAQLPPLSDVVTRESGAWLFDVLEGSGFVKTSDQGVIRCAVPMAAPVAGSPAYLLLVMCREQTPGLSYLYEDTLRLMCEVLSGMLRHATDVAEAESLRVKLVQADRVARLGQVTATLAHELNQPLAAMLCNAQAADRLLSHADPDVREARLALADIVEAARCADAVIRNAHTLFRKEQLNRQPIDLNLLVTRVLRAYRWESALADAAVGIDLGAGLPPVLGNEIQLQQVVRNLLGNACDAVKENSIGQRLITVSTRRDEREGVELCVRDSGSGIPEGFEERIFVPFYTTKEGGLGMGLPICRQIVEKHGGSIRAERVPEGGSLFRIVLPPAMGPRSGASV